jgi:inorganic pyrophosphatase
VLSFRAGASYPPEGPGRDGQGPAVSARAPVEALPRRLRCRVEVPRGSRQKRGPDGRLEFWSPWPCPFAYGSVEGLRGADGDPQDALVLGPTLARGALWEGPLRARVAFRDGGLVDDKWVGADAPLDGGQLELLWAFFQRYAAIKAALGLLRGRRGPTRIEGIALLPDVGWPDVGDAGPHGGEVGLGPSHSEVP